MNSYKAMQVVRAGVLELASTDAPDPARGEVLIAVEACGICGADASGSEKAAQAQALGAHRYVDSTAEDAAKVLQSLVGAQLILTATTHSPAVGALFAGLAPRGKLLVAGGGRDPIPIPPGRLVAGKRIVEGAITGSPIESEQTLDFSVLADVRPKIEVMPLEQAGAAYARMQQGKANFRMVLKIG